jgi:hypothetical protein
LCALSVRSFCSAADKLRGLLHDFPSVLDVEVPGNRLATADAECGTTLLFAHLSPLRFQGNVNAVKAGHDREHGAVELDDACAWFERDASCRRMGCEFSAQIPTGPIEREILNTTSAMLFDVLYPRRASIGCPVRTPSGDSGEEKEMLVHCAGVSMSDSSATSAFSLAKLIR